MVKFNNKDVDRVRYYTSNSMTFIKDLKDKLDSIPEDKQETTWVDVNESMKIQLSNTIENLMLSIAYLYDFPYQDFNDILIRLENLFKQGVYKECLSLLKSNKNDYLISLETDYYFNLLEYQYIYDIKSNDKEHFSYKEFSCIVNILNDIFNISVILMSQGDLSNFIISDKKEYKTLVNKYTLTK